MRLPVQNNRNATTEFVDCNSRANQLISRLKHSMEESYKEERDLHVLFINFALSRYISNQYSYYRTLQKPDKFLFMIVLNILQVSQTFLEICPGNCMVRGFLEQVPFIQVKARTNTVDHLPFDRKHLALLLSEISSVMHTNCSTVWCCLMDT